MAEQYYAIYDPTDPAQPRSITTVLPDPLPAGLAAAPIPGAIGAGQVWDPATRAVVAAPVAAGLPAGALVYVLDPADPLGMPVDVQPAAAPAPAAPKTTVPLKTQPKADFEWDGTLADFVQAPTLGDRITHGLLLGEMALGAQWRLLRDLRAEAATRSASAPVQDGLQRLVDRAWRKVHLTLQGQALLG